MVKAALPALIIFFIFAPTVNAQTVVINEFLSNPSLGNDWVELYNTTGSDFDLTGWVLEDNTSFMKTLAGSISGAGFITFDVFHRLNNGGDSIILKDSSGTTIDNYTYSSDPGIDISMGRSPDGGGWTTLTSSSKGSTNGGASLPTPTPTSSTSPTPTIISSSFIISNVPSQINSNQTFSVVVDLNLFSNPNTTFYLKGAFKKSDNSNYFGLTKVGSNWVKNGTTYSDQLSITTDSSGHWTGNIEIQPDSGDSGFEGSGQYIFKVGRYSQSGSGPTWSNETTLTINQVSSPTTSPSSTPSPTTPVKPTTSPVSTTGNFKNNLASVAGIIKESTPSSTSPTLSQSKETEVKSERQFNPLPFFAGGIALIGSGVYIFYKQKLQSKK